MNDRGDVVVVGVEAGRVGHLRESGGEFEFRNQRKGDELWRELAICSYL